MSRWSRALRALRTGATELAEQLRELGPAPSRARLLQQTSQLEERVRADLGRAVAACHLADKRLAALRALEHEAERRPLARELAASSEQVARLEGLLAAVASVAAELRRAPAEPDEDPTDAGESAPYAFPDRVDSRAPEREVRRRLRALEQRRRR